MQIQHRRRRIALALSTSVALAVTAATPKAFADLAAFPGAEGFGGNTTGARAVTAPTIVVVNTLNDDPAGAVAGQTTLRDALGGSNRIVVFAVGGYINLNSTAISAKSNLTILGQTAPGQGVSTQGAEISFSNQHNVILQYFRGREGSLDTNEKTAFNLGNSTNMILDHVDAELAQYDNIDDVYPDAFAAVNHTIQNSMIADPIKAQQFNDHEEGASVTYLNNIWANAHNRNPLAKGDSQFVNNVVYDYQGGFTTGDSTGNFKYDIVNNYFIAGPSTSSPGDAFYQLSSAHQSAYAIGNMLDSNKNGVLDGSSLAASGTTALSTYYNPDTKYLPTLSASDAVTFDLAHSGDLYNANGTWTRDEVDSVIASQVASLGTTGSIINTQTSDGASTGGFGTLANASIVGNANFFDTVPITWIAAHGIAATTAGLLTKNALGYFMIEQYAQEVGDQYGTMVASAGDYSSLTYPASSPAIYTHLVVSGAGATNGTLTISSADTAAGAFSVGIGLNGPAAGETLNVTGGSLTVQDTIYIGYQNNGSLNLSGGTVMADNIQLGNTVYPGGVATSYNGNLNITGGTLQVENIVLGAGTPGNYTSGGSINWSGGTIEAFGNLSISAPIVLSGNATVNTLGPDGVTYAGSITSKITGAGSFTKAGAGVLTLSANNTFVGNTTISGGAILAANNGAFSTGTIFDNTVSGLQLSSGITITNAIIAAPGSNEFVDIPVAAAAATLADSISITGSSNQYRLGISGVGATLTLTGPSTTNTTTIITRGNIIFAGNGSLTSTQAVNIGRSSATSTATLTLQNNAVVQGNGLDFGGLNGTADDLTTTITAGGNALLSAGTGAINVNNNAIGGTVTLNLNANATLKGFALTSSGSNQGQTTLNFNGGTLLATGSDTATAFFPALGTTAKPAVAKILAGGFTVNDGGFTITIAQPLSGGADGGLTKTGAGSLALSAANTYTGNTTVTSGSLFVNNTAGSGVGSGTVVLNGGTLGGTGTIAGTIAAGAGPHTINPGAAGAVGTLTAGGLVTNTNTTLAFDLNSPATTSDLLAVTGNLSIGGGNVVINSQITPGAASLGYYKVISYTGAIAGAVSNLAVPAVANNIAYTLDTTKDAGFIDIHRGFIGDANDDGTVDLNDLNVVLNNLGAASTSWNAGNFDGAGTIDLNDLNAVLNNLGTSIPTAALADAQSLIAGTSAAPEPASLALLSVAAPLLLRRRRA